MGEHVARASKKEHVSDAFTIRKLDDEDKGYALVSWRESHKSAPGPDRVPWSYYKHEYGSVFSKILNSPESKLLGAYSDEDKLLGWLAMTPGRSVNTLHWVQVKYELDGVKLRRRGLMYALLEAAELGPRFVYTLRARREKAPIGENTSRTFDEILVHALLRDKGVVGTHVSLKDWIK